MKIDFESSKTWRGTLGINGNENVDLLRQNYLSSRKKVAAMLQNIEAEIKGLTVHDITHIDSLWHISDEIIGEQSYLNPAEGYVLGCVFLLHDAAHVSSAYKGGLLSLKSSNEWKDLVGLRFKGKEPDENSDEHAGLLFEVARIHHAKQAKELAKMSWKDPSNDTEIYFTDNTELRATYSDVIGLIAESHNWDAEKVYNTFQYRKINPPGFINEKSWEVDCLKIAFILRTADASHIDSGRAPSYLFSYINPQKISKLHWLFQNRLGRVILTQKNKLRITSGASFNENERSAWWLAFDTAKMIDKELKLAFHYLTEGGRSPFSAQSVLGIESPSSFSVYVTVNNWEPEDTSIYISNLPHLIKTLGGNALYGNDETVPFRELMQNGMDSINAAIALGYITENEGLIKVNIDSIDDDNLKISITDNGLGMSKFVMKNVLLDFGNSLWKSNAVINEHPTLLQKEFSSVGKFGIGFYSVFMISNKIEINTRRYESNADESSITWRLKFDDGLNERPYISIPSRDESLKRHGTKVTFSMDRHKFHSIVKSEKEYEFLKELDDEESISSDLDILNRIAAYLFPASKITIDLEQNGETKRAIAANDWTTIEAKKLLERRFLQPATSWREELYPIFVNEILVGRLSIESFNFFTTNSSYAIVCHRGVRAGRIYGVVGLCLSDRNNDRAARMDCLPNYPLSSWVDWANLIVEKKPKTNENCLIRLHPLIPETDLMVWNINDERCFMSQVVEQFEIDNEIIIHVGGVNYSSEDEVSEGAFDDSFIIEENIVIAPRSNNISDSDDDRIIDFISTLYNSTIDYLQSLTTYLQKKYHDIHINHEYRIIGHVDGREITRFVTVIRK